MRSTIGIRLGLLALTSLILQVPASADLTGTILNYQVPEIVKGNEPVRAFWEPDYFVFSIDQSTIQIYQTAYLYGDRAYDPVTEFKAKVEVSVNGVVVRSKSFALPGVRPGAPNFDFLGSLSQTELNYGHNSVVYRLWYDGPSFVLGKYTTFVIEADVVRT